MTLSWTELHEAFQEEGIAQNIARAQMLQFGYGSKPLKGSEILPEKNVPLNTFRVNQAINRIVAALDGSRYSPAQLQPSSILVGSYLVDVGYQNTADQMTAQKLDELTFALQNEQTGADSGAALLIDFYTNTVRRVVTKNEIDRWEAIIHGRLTRRGVDGYYEDVIFPRDETFYAVANGVGDPTVDTDEGSGTVDDPKGWYTREEDYDPIDILLHAKDTMEDAGYQVDRIFAPRNVANAFQRNPIVAKVSNSVITVNTGGTLDGVAQRPSRTVSNEYLLNNELPAIEVYNVSYTTETGVRKFMEPPRTPEGRDYLVLVGSTDEDSELHPEEEGQSIILPNVLGYFALGTCTQMSSPGRKINSRVTTDHPEGIYTEVIQASIPVIQHPLAIFVIAIDRPAQTQPEATRWARREGNNVIDMQEAIRLQRLRYPAAA